MKRASLVVSEFYNQNRIFDLNDVISNRDNCLHPFYMLKQFLANEGIELATSDIHSPESSEIVIYNEMPTKLPSKKAIEKSYLLLFESELIRPDNWSLSNHNHFKKIFTWNDDFIDNNKYFKINFAQQLPQIISKDSTTKKKLCTLISGNKKVKHPLELYSKRIEAIRWFEQHHPDDFDLYGMGWGNYRFTGPKLIRALNRIHFLTKKLAPSYPSYKGKIDEKKSVLKKYKFVICFENARDIPGYITEKIFDCLVAGCIPVYWGANNITQHIPSDCFIDKRGFDTYESLYQFMNEMPDQDYKQHLNAIENFLTSGKGYQFSSEDFSKTLVRELIND